MTMTYRQLLETIREAEEREHCLAEHLDKEPISHRGPRPHRTRIDPDPTEYDNWDSERRHLEDLLDEEISLKN